MSKASPAVRSPLSIESMDEFRANLAEITDPGEIRRISDLAEAARRYAQTAEQQYMAAVAKLWTAWRGGQLLVDLRDNGQRARSGQDSQLATLDDLGVTKDDSSRWQRIYRGGESALTRYIEEADEPTFTGALAIAERSADGKTVVSSKTNEWYTPARYIEAARRTLGRIDLDPASNEEANRAVQAQYFYTAEDDGLAQDWSGRVWLNPPYGRIAGAFIDKLLEEHRDGRVKAAVALVNAHCTDTEWFQPLWDHTLCFTDHRIDFAGGTDRRSGSTHGSVFAYMGPARDRFADEFSTFGAVVRRWP